MATSLSRISDWRTGERRTARARSFARLLASVFLVVGLASLATLAGGLATGIPLGHGIACLLLGALVAFVGYHHPRAYQPVLVFPVLRLYGLFALGALLVQVSGVFANPFLSPFEMALLGVTAGAALHAGSIE